MGVDRRSEYREGKHVETEMVGGDMRGEERGEVLGGRRKNRGEVKVRKRREVVRWGTGERGDEIAMKGRVQEERAEGKMVEGRGGL